MNFVNLETIFYFRQYLELADNGFAQPLLCPSDAGRLYTGAEGEELFLFCLECDYKLYPGINLIDRITQFILNWSKDTNNPRKIKNDILDTYE